MYVSEGERWAPADIKWAPADIKRIRRVRDTRPIPLPHKDKGLWELGHGIQFTMRDGSKVAVQGWCLSPWPKKYWATVYAGQAFAGEMRLVEIKDDATLTMDGLRYRPDGKRAHTDGTACPCPCPCKECW